MPDPGKEKKKIFFLILVFILLTGLVPPFVLKHKLEKALGAPIHGLVIPTLVAPLFYVKDVQFVWKDKLECRSGNVWVRYNLVSFFLGHPRLEVSGKNLNVRLLGQWAKMGSEGEALVDNFDTEFVATGRGLEQVNRLIVSSSKFQFRLEPSENKFKVK